MAEWSNAPVLKTGDLRGSGSSNLSPSATAMGQNEHYYIGKRNLQSEHHWEPLDSETFHITKPTVICLGGNGSIKPHNANFICKVAQSLVGIKEPRWANEIATTQDVDFIGIAYGNNYEDDNSTGSLTQSEITTLTKSIFEPLYRDEKGQIRPDAQIIRNFNQITFFAHCHGAREAGNLISRAMRNMLDSGIAHKTAEAAIGQLFAVSYAPIITIPCPNLQVITEKDGFLLGGPLLAPISNKFLDERFEEENQGKGTVVFQEDDYTISLIVSNMTQHGEVEHPVGTIQRDNHWQMVEKDFAYGDEVSRAMGVALSYSIVNSLKNQKSDNWTPRPPLKLILQKVQSILGNSQNSDFAHRIEQIQNEQNELVK